MELWKYPGSKDDAKGWMVPKMLGFEGLRMEIPNPDTPLARWRINPRGCLSYTVLVTCPDIMSYDVNKEWTDMQCIEMLENIQAAHNLSEGTIPASVFAVAITHFTARALDEGQKASQSMQEGGHPTYAPHSRRRGIVGTWAKVVQPEACPDEVGPSLD